jgi:uncharacterized protein
VTPDQPIIDVDTHLTDADQVLWKPFFAAADTDLIPRVVTVEGVDRLDVAGMLLPKPAGPGIGSPLGIGAADHVATLEDRVAFQQKLGIRHAFLLPGFVGLAALDHPDPHARTVLAAAHNELVHHLSSQVAEIEFVPVVLPDDPQWSLAELDRWASRATVRAVVSRPTTHQPRPYRDGTGSPLLARLAETGTVLMLHGATGYHQASPMADQFDDYRLTHVFSHPFEQMLALADLVHSGALEAGLRLAVVEAGCGWLPWFVGRLQEHYDHTGGLPRIDRDVTELLGRQVLLSVEPGDEGIDAVLDRFGAGLLSFGSDFPHWDAARPEDLTTMAARLGPEPTHRILYGNAHRFFFGEGAAP